MGFQKTVNADQAPAVEGDFASTNPYASAIAIPGGLVAGALGVIVGRFGWIGSDDITVSNSGNTTPDGFVHRDQQGLITVFLAEASMVVPQGLPITIMKQGDFWAKNLLNAAVKGYKVFANRLTGAVTTAAAGSTIAGGVGTATFATNVMTVATSTGAPLAVNDVVTSAGVAAGTYILAQTSGTPGGVGTYTLSTSPGTLTPAQAFTTTGYIETRFYCDTAGDVNDLIKISTWG